MSEVVNFNEVEEKVLNIRGQDVILDRDVAELYGVETKEVNQAVKNNSNKFPEGYIISLSAEEWNNLKSKILTSSWGGKHKLPKAFTEKGLYMLATILKSQRATETTIAIVETFAKIRELSKAIHMLPDVQDACQKKELMQRSGEIFADILDDSMFEVSGDETTFELDLAIMKVRHTVKREKRKKEK